jgi:ferrous iron transport protein B
MKNNKAFIIGLLGNPNSGKSSLFNQLTGLRQHVGNFPGVTVEKKVGTAVLSEGDEITLVDFPGTYSLHPTTQDERVVLNVIANPADEFHPNAVVYVADVMHLEKHLLLFTQIQNLGLPMVLVLSMNDIAEKEGLDIDTKQLEKDLGSPIVAISNRTGEGLVALKVLMTAVKKASSSFLPKPIYKHYSSIEKKLTSTLEKAIPEADNAYRNLLWLHHYEQLPFLTEEEKEKVGEIAIENHSEYVPLRGRINETMQRFDIFTPIIHRAIKAKVNNHNTLTDKIDSVVMHRVFGPIVFFILMLLIFQAIFTWSSIPMGWIEQGIGGLSSLARNTLPTGWFTDLLTDGLIAGLGGVLIFIPQIAILFFLISILEEVGYMSRAVFMFDKVMQRFGLNGRSIVALISGGACAIPAVMSTRTISNWKERLITIMVTPLISCSARIPVYIVLIGFVVPSVTVLGIFNAQALVFMGLYLLGIVAALGSAFVFNKILKTNERSFLMIQLPEYRSPEIRNVGMNVYEKVKSFTLEAGKIILIISVVLWVFATFGPVEGMKNAQLEAQNIATEQNLTEAAAADLLASKTLEASYAGHFGKFIEPAIRPLGFDWKIGIALITSFAAREVFVGTMATIYSIGSTEDEYAIQKQMAKEIHPTTGEPVYTMATSLSLLLFYVFAMQCMSTLAVVKRETNSWKWPTIQFVFMSVLAYLSSFVVYQLLS